MKPGKRKEILVEHGLRLFKEKGYDAVSVDEICHAAGVTKPTFYNHIGHKEMILVEYFQAHSLQSVEDAQVLFDEGKVAAAFQRLFIELHAVISEMGAPLFRVYRKHIFKDPTYDGEFIKSQEQMLEACICRMQEEEQISNQDNPAQIARVLLELNDGITLFWAARNGSFDFARIFRNWAKNILGVKMPSGPRPLDIPLEPVI